MSEMISKFKEDDLKVMSRSISRWEPMITYKATLKSSSTLKSYPCVQPFLKALSPKTCETIICNGKPLSYVKVDNEDFIVNNIVLSKGEYCIPTEIQYLPTWKYSHVKNGLGQRSFFINKSPHYPLSTFSRGTLIDRKTGLKVNVEEISDIYESYNDGKNRMFRYSFDCDDGFIRHSDFPGKCFIDPCVLNVSPSIRKKYNMGYDQTKKVCNCGPFANLIKNDVTTECITNGVEMTYNKETELLGTSAKCWNGGSSLSSIRNGYPCDSIFNSDNRGIERIYYKINLRYNDVNTDSFGAIQESLTFNQTFKPFS